MSVIGLDPTSGPLSEAKGRPAVEDACEGAPFFALFTANDVRAAHIAQSKE